MKFLFTRPTVASETPAGQSFEAGHVYELTSDNVARWQRRGAGRAVAANTPLGLYKSPEERAAERAAATERAAAESKSQANTRETTQTASGVALGRGRAGLSQS